MAPGHVAQRNGPGGACRARRRRPGAVSSPGCPRPSSRVAPGPLMKGGQRMRRRLISRLPPEDAYAHLDFERSASDRELLLHAALEAGLQPSSVFDLTEALTGRPWVCTGPP